MLLYLPHGLSYIMGEGEQWKLKKLELLIQSLWAMWDAENGMQKKIKGGGLVASHMVGARL